jgi:hypothetical protein
MVRSTWSALLGGLMVTPLHANNACDHSAHAGPTAYRAGQPRQPPGHTRPDRGVDANQLLLGKQADVGTLKPWTSDVISRGATEMKS